MESGQIISNCNGKSDFAKNIFLSEEWKERHHEIFFNIYTCYELAGHREDYVGLASLNIVIRAYSNLWFNTFKETQYLNHGFFVVADSKISTFVWGIPFSWYDWYARWVWLWEGFHIVWLWFWFSTK